MAFGNCYSGLKVFVTGHTGFKGSWLCAWLLSLGAKVAGFSLGVPTNPANFCALDLGRGMLDLRGDVRDLSALKKAVSDFAPDIVFHLAAQALVRASYDDPVSTFETNMLGTMNVLEALRHTDARAAIIITSDKCYRNDEWVWGYRESDSLGGSDPYSASKGCAELIAHSYFDSFFQTGCACATVRAGNVIGGGDWACDRIVPDCVRAWQEQRPVEIRNPGATRPWQHVLEPLSGYLWLGRALLSGPDSICRGQSYNFGPSADAIHPVAELVDSFSRFWPGFRSKHDFLSCQDKKECNLLKLCCDKALAHLNWRATLNFEETIRYTAEWYARYYARGDCLMSFALGQIDAYTNLARQRGEAWAG